MKISKGFQYTLIAAVSWAACIVGIKFLLRNGENSYNIVFWLALLVLPYWIMIFIKRVDLLKTIKKNDYLVLLGMGIISGILLPIIEVFAIKYSPAINYSFLIRSVVLFTAVFAYFFLSEKLTWKKIVLILLVVVGVFLLTTEGKMPHFTLGDILTLIQAALISFGNTILGKKAVKFVDSKFAASFVILFGFLPILVITLLNHAVSIPQLPLVFIFIAIISTVGTIYRFNAYKNATASFITVVYTLTPVMVSFAAIPLFKESLSSIQIIGAGLIIATGLLAEKLEK